MAPKGVRKSGYIFEYRFTLMGSLKTGKTSVLNRFINDTFSQRYRPTVEDHVTHIMEHNGNMCVCLIVDTCGGTDFPAMRRLAISKGNAFFLFYAIDDRKTFENAKQLVKEIEMCEKGECKVIIIGNKADLEADRQVSETEGEQLSKDLCSKKIVSEFFEVSAKYSQNVDLVFLTMLNLFLPQIEIQEMKPEKSAFSRISLRRKSRKTIKKQSSVDYLKSDYNSDNDMLTRRNTNPDVLSPNYLNTGQLLRSSSLATDIFRSDSDSGIDSSPKDTPKIKRKNILQKTFGSMQRLFKPDNEDAKISKNTKRAQTFD